MFSETPGLLEQVRNKWEYRAWGAETPKLQSAFQVPTGCTENLQGSFLIAALHQCLLPDVVFNFATGFRSGV